ncbi:hypothetical protein P3S67_026478 [Capsicum chacoense]
MEEDQNQAELFEEQKLNQDMVEQCEKQHKENAEKIEEYENYFVTVLKDKPQEGIAVKLMDTEQKIWNFTENRLATPEECCKAVKREIKLRSIKARRYDEWLSHKAIHAHLQLDDISALATSLGKIRGEDMTRLVFRAVIEGNDNVLEIIERCGAYFKKIKEVDADAFRSGLFEALEEAWLLGEFKPKNQLVVLVHKLCKDEIIDGASIANWCDEMDDELLNELMLLEVEVLAEFQ